MGIEDAGMTPKSDLERRQEKAEEREVLMNITVKTADDEEVLLRNHILEAAAGNAAGLLSVEASQEVHRQINLAMSETPEAWQDLAGLEAGEALLKFKALVQDIDAGTFDQAA